MGRIDRMPAAVLFDRDGTLVVNVPYNADPGRVTPMPEARAALDRLRAASVPVGVVSNQSGIAKGLIDLPALDAVNTRVEELLGPFDIWAVCPHDEGDGCPCRKPAPGLILRAAAVLGVAPRDCVVIGDIGRDMGAAHAAGARGILVPTPETRPVEVASAWEVANDLGIAVEMALSGSPAEPARLGGPAETARSRGPAEMAPSGGSVDTALLGSRVEPAPSRRAVRGRSVGRRVPSPPSPGLT